MGSLQAEAVQPGAASVWRRWTSARLRADASEGAAVLAAEDAEIRHVPARHASKPSVVTTATHRVLSPAAVPHCASHGQSARRRSAYRRVQRARSPSPVVIIHV